MQAANMGTELIISRLKEEDIDFPPVPPGFEGFSSFKLRRTENNNSAIGYSVPPNISEKLECLKSESDLDNAGKISRSLRRRPWINYGQFDNNSDDESDSGCSDQRFPSRHCLPKGVIRGCPECTRCQKVTARWRPEAASRPDLEDVPAFYPNEEEFQDPIKYIARIRPKAESYGICRIVPPPSWKPPCLLKEKHIWEHSTFATRIQRVDKLQNRGQSQKLSELHNHTSKKRRRCSRMGGDCGPIDALDPGEAGFGFEPGPEFTLDAFQTYADDFKVQYFRKTVDNQYSRINLTNIPKKWEPSVETIEGEYWRMVEKPTEEIEVLYGADLETGVFGSGFPKISSGGSSEEYVKSGWNLNNLSRLPGSVLSYESAGISGVQVPWLYIGMCFSSFCWHVEDHHLYSLNYMHFGAPKLWYGVPGKEAANLERAMRKHLPDLFKEQPDLLHKLVTQLSPAILKSEGVPVYRCIQNPGEFVLTFPRAYHSGFNCGFNCAEAVNVAPLDWFPHGQNAVEIYREQRRKTTISHDKLLLGTTREAVKAYWELNLLRKNTKDNLKWKDIYGKDGILAKSLRARVEMEYARRRESLCKPSKVLKMDLGFDAATERECSICFYDLHLSAAGCSSCSPDRFACLSHTKQLCTCAWSDRFFLFRYDITELNLLVEAVEGKLSAVYRWARLDLGLAISHPPHISEDKNSRENGGMLGMLFLQQPEEVYLGRSATGMEEEEGKLLSVVGTNLSQDAEVAAAGSLSDELKKHSRTKFLLKKDGNKLTVSCLDKYYRQKGPCIAKVVRRTIDCNVELLECGVVLSGKLWSTSQAIFPKGFRSRVRYIDISDPTNVCFYISEIIDGGTKGPLFMVSLERCPNAVFAHVSPTRCWEMVRERVNQEISKQHKLGKKKLPPLQPPGSLDGLEMFGLTSPAITQAIEALDEKDRLSREYWSSRPFAQVSQPKENCQNKVKVVVGGGAQSYQNPPSIAIGVEVALGGLFKKANPEELHSLLETILDKERPVADHNLLIRLLKEEIQRRSSR
ncbi:hypothetical protein Dimus_012334 [Dionaea muscipula]